MKQYLDYAEFLQASQEVNNWINSVLKNYLKKHPGVSSTAIEHVLDYLVSDAAPARLLKMSFDEASRNAQKWSASNQKKGRNLDDTDEDIELFLQFEDGYSIQLLKTENAFKREGYLMRHCLGGYNVEEGCRIYSLRDAKNMPHATFEVVSDEENVVQIKGKGNGAIHPKYIDYVLKFLDAVGHKIRPSEMQNLGYYYLDPAWLAAARTLISSQEKIVTLKGENYVVKVA